jgi:hypothetical protein
MRFAKCSGCWLAALALLAAALVNARLLFADDEPKSETPPPAVREVLDCYLKALAANDLLALNRLAAVPWLDRDRTVIRTTAELSKAIERLAHQLPPCDGERKVWTLPYQKARARHDEQAEHTLVGEVVGERGWLAAVEADGDPLSMRVILIGVKDGRPAVVGGPLKQNQLSPHNRIPEAVDRLLDRAEAYELYSLDPERKSDPARPKGNFHGWDVLGKTEVRAEADRRRLADALRLGAEDNFGMAGACFIPRHGLRLRGGGKSVDLVICFQCFQVQVFEDGRRKEGFLTTGGPQQAFDAMLQAAGVELPTPAKK